MPKCSGQNSQKPAKKELEISEAQVKCRYTPHLGDQCVKIFWTVILAKVPTIQLNILFQILSEFLHFFSHKEVDQEKLDKVPLFCFLTELLSLVFFSTMPVGISVYLLLLSRLIVQVKMIVSYQQISVNNRPLLSQKDKTVYVQTSSKTHAQLLHMGFFIPLSAQVPLEMQLLQ